MQPPPQAVPSGLVGPPPAGKPQSLFWSNSPYRRQAPSSAPVASLACPLPPVTDPFAFSRQALQNPSPGGPSKSSPPILTGPAPSPLLQRPGPPMPQASAGERAQSQPGPGAGPFHSCLAPGPEMNQSTEVAPSSEAEVQALPHLPQYIPGAGAGVPLGGHPPGGVPGPDGPLSRPAPHDGTMAPAGSTFFPQPLQQGPGQWGPVQGGPPPSGQHYWPCPEGSVPNTAPRASGIPHFPAPALPRQGPSHERHNPMVSLPGPLAAEGGAEAVYLHRGDQPAPGSEPELAFRQKPRAGTSWAAQEARPNPGANKEQFLAPLPGHPPTQGSGPESHLHAPLGLGAARAPPEADSGALSMFFQGGETENEENLSSGRAGSAGPPDPDAFSPSTGPGHPPAHAPPRGSGSEAAPQGRQVQPFLPWAAGTPREQQASAGAAVDPRAGAGPPGASPAQFENMENLEFVQNQEVLPSEPLGLDLSPSDQLRYGPAAPRLGAGGLAAGGGPNLEAPDPGPGPPRSESGSSSYGRSRGSLPGVARPQDLGGTFIQQEVGRPEEEALGGFFQQIDSSPLGGEAEETAVSQNRRGTLSQPSTPSPPKPTGVFQTSANSSFEPVKSHLVGVKPVEADRANVVGEVRGAHAHQRQHRADALPDSSPGNLEQPPDNMETLLPPTPCPRPTPAEAGPGPLRTGGLPLDTLLPAPEKKPSARAQGPVKCESPATTLWAQSELPDFGGNVLLAPAAPALRVPARAQPSGVTQPPDGGAPTQPPCPPASVTPLQSGEAIGASENLENPPKLGEEEPLPPQASSGHAGVLASPPVESLRAQPDQSCSLTRPVPFSVSSSSPSEKSRPWKEAVAGEKAALGSRAGGGDSGEGAPLSGIPSGSLLCLPLSNSAQSNFPQVSGTCEMVSSQPASLLVQPPSHPAPRNLPPESQKLPKAENILPELVHRLAGSTGVVVAPPASNTSAPGAPQADPSGTREEASGAPDVTARRSPESPVRMCSPSHPDGPASCRHAVAGQPRHSGPRGHNPDPFYQQVTKDAQDQQGLEGTQQGPQATFPESSSAGSPPAPAQSLSSAQPPASRAPADSGQQLPPRPPRSSSASVVSTSSSQAAARSDQPWPQPLPPDYYYYRPLYDGYQPPYPTPYPPDPGVGTLYYQDAYGLCEPRYRPYDSAASAYAQLYRHPEPERPSSRASHCSDQPPARREHPEGYYASQSTWSDYYSHYYPGQYDYGDLGRWDRYHYGARLRDPRAYDQRYWCDAEYDLYRRESYAHGDRPEKGDDHWRYDPRFAGSFDDDPEPRRDPYGEEADRRSVHSEHSAQSLHSAASLHSRRSSFSSHSQQSQVYRSHHVSASAYEAPAPPGSFHGDYPYGAYRGNFGSAQGFPEYGYGADANWPAMEQVPSRPTSPEKFSVPHLCARFGPGGQLIKVIPNLPSEGQPALVEVHSMETLLQHTPEQEEMLAFPGPLGRDDTHKVDVINFAQNKATKCLQNDNLIDKESASLLWNFIVLLCRQNGTVVGTDIAELLLRDHRTVWLPGKSPDEANLIDFTNEAVEQVEEEESGEAQLSFLTGSQAAPASSDEKETERFRELLLYGRKKDALESAMKNALWGHALLLASKMDSRTHARVMTRFANSLPINDPLQTVYQLMSGRMPAASTCCGDEKWGDWRPHLAMVLSNLSNNVDVESRTMATMGDTLASRGLLEAAHFCYLMAQVGFGVYTKKTTKLVLIGSNHSLPFLKFATNEAIQRTEAYEYAQSLGAQTCPLPNFQVFKFIYSCRLAEMGLATQAFHYCEVIAESILAQPHIHSPVLISQLVQVASQLRLFDPQLKEKPEEESFLEPAWLVRLRHVDKQVQEGAVLWSQDVAFPQQCPSTPSSELGQCDGPALAQPTSLGVDNPLLAPPVQGVECLAPGVRLLPSAPQVLPDGQPAIPARVPMFPVLPPPGPIEPGPALGFSEPSGPDLAALYPGPGLLPVAPPLQDLRTQEPGAGLLEAPGGSPLPELRDGDCGQSLADLGPSGVLPDSEAPMAWEPPPQPPTPAPDLKRAGSSAAKKETKEPKKSSEPWFFSRWLSGKRRTEAYLPDDKNKSIVWDEKKNRWVDVNEPDEEKSAPPPPPTSLPKATQAAPAGPGGPPRASVNMFSRKAAGTRARYVDVLNPGGTRRTEPALAPADFFAPLAPLPIPAHLLGPQPDAERAPPADGAAGEGQALARGPAPPELTPEPKVPGPAAVLPGSLDGNSGGELSRCSSMSSLSREVSQHLAQAPGGSPSAGSPPGGAVPFYNPAQFSAASGSARTGRAGQRKYPALS
ncbi:protein transport protein Sec16A isoform X2 [Talpa occidentalis]|uniref:protein transport protein Sec16A isoform X2 n=1 Tax=Talpa occidentalis TaxID=50954 RepID=UPI00188EADB2|nr:protein transport protein Sec16A isoform X2 [Talpa occidentalis]